MKTSDISIHGTERELSLQKPQKPSREDMGFQDFLKEELVSGSKITSSENALQSYGSQAIFHIPPHVLLALDASGQGNEQPMEGLTKALDAFGGLEQALANPSISPRGIEQQFQTIQSELLKLEGTLSHLPSDHPLKAVSMEMNILAHVESVKWNRGDYL